MTMLIALLIAAPCSMAQTFSASPLPLPVGGLPGNGIQAPPAAGPLIPNMGGLSVPTALPSLTGTLPALRMTAVPAVETGGRASWSEEFGRQWPRVEALLDSQGEDMPENLAEGFIRSLGLPPGSRMKRITKMSLSLKTGAQQYNAAAYGTLDSEGRFHKAGYFVTRVIGNRNDEGKPESGAYAFMLSAEGSVTKTLAANDGHPLEERPLDGLEDRLLDTLAYLLSDAPAQAVDMGGAGGMPVKPLSGAHSW